MMANEGARSNVTFESVAFVRCACILMRCCVPRVQSGRALDALHVLRNELTPLGHDTARVHRLSALMMCGSARELRARAAWPGGAARHAVLARVQAVLPPALMLAPGRLRGLLAQAQRQQTARCRFHTQPRPPHDLSVLLPFTLLADHNCGADAFPIHPLQVLPLYEQGSS